MTPQEHKERAERLLRYATDPDGIPSAGGPEVLVRMALDAAQVHATLALVPASAIKGTPEAERHWQSAMDMQRQRNDVLSILRDEVKRAQRTRSSSEGIS